MNVVNQLFKTHFMVIPIYLFLFTNNISTFPSQGSLSDLPLQS